MSRSWFGARRKPKRREVFPKRARTSGGAGGVRKGVRRNGSGRSGRGWVWPAIGFLVFVEALLLGGHAVRWAKASRHFELSKVVVAGHRTLRPEDVVKLAAIRPGASIFDADLEAVRGRVDSHPWIKRVSVRRRPPHFLHVAIVERRPAALLAGAAPMLVDEEGVVLGRPMKPRAGCLPLIEGFASRNLRPGDVVRDARLARSMRAAFLFRGSPVIREGCVSVRGDAGGQLRLRALEGRVELVVSEERMESQAERLRAVARDVLREEALGAGGLRLDLRFPGRVIVRSLAKDGGSRG